MTEKPTREIQLSVELDATPDDVFRAVTEGTEVAKWLAPEARSTPPTGGNKARLWISWGGGMEAEKEIEIYDHPTHIRHESGKNAETKAPLYADWLIEARDGGTTTLRLVHSGFSVGADWDDDFDSHARGWKLMLQNLRHYFARHKHAPASHLAFMTKVESSRVSLWGALVAKLGLATEPKVGDAFRFTTASGETVTGVVDFASGSSDLGLVVRDYDDALLRFTMMGKPDGASTFVFGYAIAYGANQARAKELVDAGTRAVAP